MNFNDIIDQIDLTVFHKNTIPRQYHEQIITLLGKKVLGIMETKTQSEDQKLRESMELMERELAELKKKREALTLQSHNIESDNSPLSKLIKNTVTPLKDESVSKPRPKLIEETKKIVQEEKKLSPKPRTIVASKHWPSVPTAILSRSESKVEKISSESDSRGSDYRRQESDKLGLPETFDIQLKIRDDWMAPNLEEVFINPKTLVMRVNIKTHKGKLEKITIPISRLENECVIGTVHKTKPCMRDDDHDTTKCGFAHTKFKTKSSASLKVRIDCNRNLENPNPNIPVDVAYSLIYLGLEGKYIDISYGSLIMSWEYAVDVLGKYIAGLYIFYLDTHRLPEYRVLKDRVELSKLRAKISQSSQ